MVNIMVDESSKKLLIKVPLFNNANNRKTQPMARDLNDQLTEKNQKKGIWVAVGGGY